MDIQQTSLPGVCLVVPRIHTDERGSFVETYRSDLFESLGFPVVAQENHSRSVAGVLRGLHYQLDRPQAKLVRAIRGRVLDVALDVRLGSPTFGCWTAHELSDENGMQLFVPVGFAHGFCVLDGPAEVVYKCSDYYSGPADQRCVLWSDPGLAIPWPIRAPLLSRQDATAAPLDVNRSDLPRWREPSPRT